MDNPLFPTGTDAATRLSTDTAGQPLLPADDDASRRAAADLIRQKVADAYADEPSAADGLAAAQPIAGHTSKHQAYMQQLKSSGKSLVEIQMAWHTYYTQLPDSEKHEVWREFYSSQAAGTPLQQAIQQPAGGAASQPAVTPAAHIYPTPATQPTGPPQSAPQPPAQTESYLPTITLKAQSGVPAWQRQPEFSAFGANQPAAGIPLSAPTQPQAPPVPQAPTMPQPTVSELKDRIRQSVSAGGKLKAKHHFQSLAFGLASGLVVVFIFLFSFFNEVFISPFIQPSRRASETPVIVDPASAVVGAIPKVIIPKINVEIPVDYTQTSNDNKLIESALDNGVVHYPTTPKPGEPGNSVFFGHSSNNIFNPGKYKFAFVLLHELVEGDTFYLTREGKAYAYRVVQRRVVEPTEVGVLGPVSGFNHTATLITCDPPGTSLKRLIVVGEQVSPTPDSNATPAQPQPGTPPILSATETQSLPGNGPTFWARFWNSVF